ncbi:DUF305 domain-containing protein [filamentous cyanobacterium CCP1]|nr:DUF305 domain-containing protein [filamentous cyanobacterium CCP2]PSB68332.1 DUF305 domain-containing protein [filamentous cyanobacterium CCP1]
MRHKLASFVALGMIPFASLSLAACTNAPSTQGSDLNNLSETITAQSSSSESPVAQMDHGSMDGSMPMNHDSMSMDLGPADESFDLRFIDAMILHHQGAVEMAQEALEKSSRPEIQELAQSIIDGQEQEISQMQEWRQAWYPDAPAEPVAFDANMGHTMAMPRAMQDGMMMAGDLGAADEEFDLRFINAMIPHHEGAVVMAQEALAKSDRLEVKELAQAIIDAQQPEIDQMTQWRQAWYNQ